MAPDPMPPLDPMPYPRCSARRRDGERCTQPAMRGSTVCRMHGGAAPQVRRAAQFRLWELVNPAIAVLAREMTNPDARPAERIRAAEAVLDRAGLPRQIDVSPTDARDLAKQWLLQQVAERFDGQADAAAGVIMQAREIVSADQSDPEEDPQ